LRKGNDAAGQDDWSRQAVAIERDRGGLEQLQEGPCRSLRGQAISGQQGDDGPGSLSRDGGGGTQSLLDAIGHSPGKLAACVGANLGLQAVEASDVEDRNVLLTLGICGVFDMLLRRSAHFPHIWGATAADGVVSSERAGGGLESHGAECPQCRLGRREGIRSPQGAARPPGAHGWG